MLLTFTWDAANGIDLGVYFLRYYQLFFLFAFMFFVPVPFCWSVHASVAPTGTSRISSSSRRSRRRCRSNRSSGSRTSTSKLPSGWPV